MFHLLNETHPSAGRMLENYILMLLKMGESQRVLLRSFGQGQEATRVRYIYHLNIVTNTERAAH